MSNQTQKDTKPQLERWFVLLFPGSLRMGIFGLKVIPLARLTVIDQKLTVKELPEFFYSFQLIPQQVYKIAPSKITFLPLALSIPFFLLFILVPILVSDAAIPTKELSIFVPVALLILTAPATFLKCFKMKYKIRSYTGHIYFFCLRHQSSSIINALIRCGFGDKLEQSQSAPHPE